MIQIEDLFVGEFITQVDNGGHCADIRLEEKLYIYYHEVKPP